MAVKYWEIIADDLSKAGWGVWGWVSTIDSNGPTNTRIAAIESVSLRAADLKSLDFH